MGTSDESAFPPNDNSLFFLAEPLGCCENAARVLRLVLTSVFLVPSSALRPCEGHAQWACVLGNLGVPAMQPRRGRPLRPKHACRLRGRQSTQEALGDLT